MYLEKTISIWVLWIVIVVIVEMKEFKDELEPITVNSGICGLESFRFHVSSEVTLSASLDDVFF